MKASKLFLSAILFTISFAASAQTYKDIEAKASHTSAQITDGLDLTGDQQTLIFRQVLTIEDTKMRMAARGDDDATIADAYAKHYEAFVANVKGVITEEQFESKKQVIADLYAPVTTKVTKTAKKK